MALQHLLELLDVADGGAESLHFAEALVRQLAGQVVSEARVPLVHAAHPLPLALVALAEKGGLQGAVQPEGQVGPPRGAAAAERRLPARGVQTHGDSEGVPQGEAGQGPGHAQGHPAQVMRQGQQSGLGTFLHHSPKRKPITPEMKLPAEDETENLQSGDPGPFRLPDTAGQLLEKFLGPEARFQNKF